MPHRCCALPFKKPPCGPVPVPRIHQIVSRISLIIPYTSERSLSKDKVVQTDPLIKLEITTKKKKETMY